MSIHMNPRGSTRASRVSDFLQKVDYRVATSERERDRIYRLRYEAYLKEGEIYPNPSQRFHDDYDCMDNCYIFGVYSGNWLLSSVRIHVISPDKPRGPALSVFPDILGPMLDAGQTLIDPTRFVVDEFAARQIPDLPFLTLRVACMASEYFEADYCLATVRKEHRAFYRRVFQSELLCEPRPYPSLAHDICLMRADVRSIRNELMERYPVFLSSFTERRMLFEDNGNRVGVERRLPILAETL